MQSAYNCRATRSLMRRLYEHHRPAEPSINTLVAVGGALPARSAATSATSIPSTNAPPPCVTPLNSSWELVDPDRRCA